MRSLLQLLDSFYFPDHPPLIIFDKFLLVNVIESRIKPVTNKIKEITANDEERIALGI